nr:hypothetical protein GCM10017611_52350 [Rhodococcus wratislaviensis]
MLDLPGWPDGMRVIVRKERPHPGAQLRFTDRDGLRLTAFVTNTEGGHLPDLELWHRRRARCEDRIRILKDTGLENLPLQGFDQNRIWLALVALAVEVTATVYPIRVRGAENACGNRRTRLGQGVTRDPRGAASQNANSGGDTVDVLWRSQAQPPPTM